MSNPLNTPDIHTLIPRFEWNARNVFEDSAPLYFRLSRELIGDVKLLVLASHIPATQPAPNLFFSAVHYLLMQEQNAKEALREFFPDLSRDVNTLDDPYPVFRAFCLAHALEIQELLETRGVQVNEIARCALFLPAFHMVSQRVGGEPLAVIEVGASAGLNLLWERYAYDYGPGLWYGARDAAIVLRCPLRGNARPTMSPEFPRVDLRFGIDLHPNDVRNEDEMLWLRALVWPEQLDRAERLARAIALAQQHPPFLVQGDALELVPRALEAISRETPVLLFHSFVLNQFPTPAREHYYELLAEFGRERRLYDLAIEPNAWPAPLVMTTYEQGETSEKTLASCDVLGRWMDWAG